MKNKFLTTFQIAAHLQVTHRTVQQWIEAGKLRSFRTPGGHNRISIKDFMHFLKEYRMPVPDEFAADEHKKILVVDDDEATVRIIAGILRHLGYTIEGARNGFEAGRKFSEFKPDLMTLDIHMPQMDGYEAMKSIRSIDMGKDLKIIVISGITDKKEQGSILARGADFFLAKPFKKEALVSLVNEALGKGHNEDVGHSL